MALPEYINLNGTNYTTAKLSVEAQNQAQNIQVVDLEIARLQQQLAIAQTARNAYSGALMSAVKGNVSDIAAPAAEKKVRQPRKAKAA